MIDKYPLNPIHIKKILLHVMLETIRIAPVRVRREKEKIRTSLIEFQSTHP